MFYLPTYYLYTNLPVGLNKYLPIVLSTYLPIYLPIFYLIIGHARVVKQLVQFLVSLRPGFCHYYKDYLRLRLFHAGFPYFTFQNKGSFYKRGSKTVFHFVYLFISYRFHNIGKENLTI